MRIFGGDNISNLMTRFNMPENEALTHPLVSKVLEQIQVKVEGYNFDVRKSLVEYDDVINKQRKIIYSLRDGTLQQAKENPASNFEEIKKVLGKETDRIASELNTPEKIALEFSEILPMSPHDRQELEKKVEASDSRPQLLFDLLLDQWSQRKSYFGENIGNDIIAYAIIETLDPLWVDHLTALDDLRDGVRLRGYAQKDPLIEYRKEGFEMFQNLMAKFEQNLARMLFRLEPTATPVSVPTNATEGRGELMTDSPEVSATSTTASSSNPVVNSSTLGRNDPCWCGSGKKFKKCHYPQLG